ncbi:Metallo-dependent phosphatase-like protein [Pseudomassariella vexata]|uniref:Metallo-dependent phosphatase-like protein n=1 Tax=Pseudomassariella vexata TaxID=1141098 RepID=A0A1Y2DD58_9PEZI|nr:Metallo-dependent phosphatase-like protein [Pseudomassariella vexata]ORY57179.1 Metallo-dependent phosphatase-like protein [Pseudomassariella vexata]
MAPSYSNSGNGYGNGNGNGYGYSSSSAASSSSKSTRHQFRNHQQVDLHFDIDEIRAGARVLLHRLWAFGNGPGRIAATNIAMQGGQVVKRNLVARRLLSFPHLLVGLWVLVLLWGERWIFASRVQSCDWDHWEKWPTGATPHRLVFVADPQIIDPHSYPGRPWPLNPLTMQITDNYLRRSYTQLQKVLQPDTVVFLGDLFDGGREWKTARGDFRDPEWAKHHRPESEQKLLKEWNRKYGEDYWLEEYGRFGDIFYEPWAVGGVFPGAWQRGRKLISSLPGNHDLGFGAEVKIPARKRFNAYFGETNRVDVIGNHTFVSVDSVSLSAASSTMKDQVDLRGIFNPVEKFLAEVKAKKRRAAIKELKFWQGEVEELIFDHKVEELNDAEYNDVPSLLKEADGPDFPTVLLTHVPLYREPGTPCGPLREHWPPAKPPKGQTDPVFPDHRNAISVSSGYQYQNVLSESDSIKLIKSIGNVIHAFSGDDHDYCELVHSEKKENVPEITVKSLSMAMGVPTPGFQMVSLWNPVDADGRPLAGDGKPTLQTHLCLLPRSFSTFTTYAALAILNVFALAARAFLFSILNLQPFALDPTQQGDRSILPVFKEKVESDSGNDIKSRSFGTSGNNLLSARLASNTRGRGASITNGAVRSISPRPKSKIRSDRWGWGVNKGPRIEIRRDFFDGGRLQGTTWRAAARPNWRTSLQSRTALIWREMWTTTWRVVWMVFGFFAYLTYKG